MQKLLTVAELADLLQLSRHQVYALKQRIGYVKIGGAVRFRPEDVERFLGESRVAPASQQREEIRPMVLYHPVTGLPGRRRA